MATIISEAFNITFQFLHAIGFVLNGGKHSIFKIPFIELRILRFEKCEEQFPKKAQH